MAGSEGRYSTRGHPVYKFYMPPDTTYTLPSFDPMVVHCTIDIDTLPISTDDPLPSPATSLLFRIVQWIVNVSRFRFYFDSTDFQNDRKTIFDDASSLVPLRCNLCVKITNRCFYVNRFGSGAKAEVQPFLFFLLPRII